MIDYIMKTIGGPIVVCLLMIVPISCSEDVEPPAAPELPPIETMVMNFSSFDNANSIGRLESQVNWGTAALNVVFWNTILTLNVALPVAAYSNAINQNPTYDADRRLWVWESNYNLAGKNYSSELSALVSSDKVVWKMKISEEGGFQNITWYTGETSSSGSTGFWLLYYSEEDTDPKLQIDWLIAGEEVSSITYTNINTGDDNEGGSIKFGRRIGDFDSFYQISLPTRSSDVNIDWNSVTRNGRIMDSVVFEDEEWHCWDENLDDVDC